MPDRPADPHCRPFVLETPVSTSLHFSFASIQSRMDASRPDALELDYTALMMGFLLFLPAPSRIGMIGLGGGSLAKFCFRHLPGCHIDVAEINPHVIELRERFNVPADGPRFRVICADGADFVRQAPGRFDVLMVDGFDLSGTPPALCSQRFYDDCFEAMQEQGLLVINMHSGHLDYALHLARLRQCFGDQLLRVGLEASGNCIVLACRGSTLSRMRGSLLRKPADFNEQAWSELLPAFGRVRSAWLKWLADADQWKS
ncbi:spermine/spermidine synthase domain-containing protein [Roseateles oligotrophus]|uniref:Transferase n=1 Tax=Roseateles oligotrophus TaxID=1769250 RepID=A0ABT2YKS6_9BURK|nr:transferase [Roseateles oligotrophus]MCV2370658.1 transferase [Roseateles oligotrophus]